MEPDAIVSPEDHESLIQFLYLAPVGLVQCDRDGAIDMINPKAAQLLLPLSSTADLDNLFAVLEGVAPQLRAQMQAFAPGHGLVCEGQRFSVDAGHTPGAAPTVLAVNVIKFDDQRFMVALSDASADERRERLALESQRQDASRTDALTDIPNRVALNEFLQPLVDARHAAMPASFAVMFINCDRFKQINDTLGHATGDQVLRMMARRLQSALRPYDSLARNVPDAQIVARLGGDEFAIVLDRLPHPDDAHAVAQRLIALLAKPYGVESLQLHCPVSMGLTLSQQVQGDADAVVQDASIAMVNAKRQGGARYVVFEPAMREQAALRGQLESELRSAIAQRQLVLAYQPVVGLRGDGADAGATDWSAGVEALVRWQHPTRGMVSPMEFIGVAEDSGLIVPLGAYVLNEAVRQFALWQQSLGERAPRLLAVNLSRAELGEPGFVAGVMSVLRQYRVEPHQLQLEVTESLAAQDTTVQARLHELRALGIGLALDDFGTGYSSLSSLHLLPVDTVKIDRAFTMHATTSQFHKLLIDATVKVARSLGMRTVAEGVETAAQDAVLRELGCDKGQGYLYSRPLAANALAQWLAQDRSMAS
ncbi:MAG: EAL domain-containing protein [Burkholderiaceae bacterium]